MSEFLEEFLNENPREMSGGDGRSVVVAAFGKHPGWNDHLEENADALDLGVRTPSLVWTKSLLYEQGVGRNIDTGSWDKLDPGHRLEEFRHQFFWHGPTGKIVGSMWSSRDGKGRARYPMVLAAHAVGTHRVWTIDTVLGRLDSLRRECVESETARQVAAALDRTRADLRSAVAESGRSQRSLSPLLAEFVKHPQFGIEHEGLLRVCYQLQGQVGPYARGHYSLKGARSSRSQSIRVPAAGRDAVAVFTAWIQLIRLFVDPEVPVLLIWPERESWLDIIIGQPAPDDLVCLRISAIGHPCASDIPFNLDPAFRTEMRLRLDAMVRCEPLKPAGSAVSRFFGSLFGRS
ncbi:MAG TPA: hypothetical protein DCY13_19540 [Verrucomicrobiales bacterium]|nr:hypothetical protein [Verrucomicrobiales bacterium]